MLPAATRLVESGPLRYLLSAPSASARRSGTPPLLVFLHGYDEAAPLPIERALTRHGPLARSSAPVARERFVVVAPQLPRAGDTWHRYGAAVAEIVAAARAASGADDARAYLTGFSFGGNGVFDLALASPDGWTALWAVDPTRVPPRDPGLPAWVSIGEAARPRTAGFVRALRLEPLGAGGPESEGADRIYLDEGLDHVRSAARAYADPRIYSWLLARSAVPRLPC